MSLLQALKAKLVTPIIVPIITAIPAVLGFFKKKTFVLWYQVIPGNPKSWVKKSGPMSKRQCRKEMAGLIALGTYIPDYFTIRRKDVTP